MTVSFRHRVPLLGFGLGLILLLALSMGWKLWNRTPRGIEGGRLAYGRGEWALAESLAKQSLRENPKATAASRLLARSLARQGKAVESVTRFLEAGTEGLVAEDLLRLAEALVALERPVLAAGAWDAAAKLDPGSSEARLALIGLNDRASGIEGGPRQVDQFTAVPDGGALAVLILGLVELTDAASKRVPGRFDRVLDRLALMERSALARIDGPDASRRLLARWSLEEGRPAEARRWLFQVTNREADREAQWLLSRVELLGGKIEEAVTAAERAGDRGGISPMDPEPCRYVGAKVCAACHSAIHRSQQASHHATTFGSGLDLAVTPLPDRVLSDPTVAGVSHRFDREGSRIVVESGKADDLVRGVVAFVMGSGHHGATMLARDDRGTLRSLRMSYYTAGDRWELTSGFPSDPPDPRQYLGEPLDPITVRDCLHCHSTRYRSPDDRSGPEATDQGIGCERCHGPGESHLKAIEEGFSEPAIARPKVATPAERSRLCAGCHAADGKIPPSDPRFIRFQSTTLPFSRCVSESGGLLDCVACHDPHRNLEQEPTHYEARCLTCHGEPAPADPNIRLKRFEATPCPVNRKGGCLPCHMPSVPEVLPFTAFTDHHVRIHREGPLVEGSSPCPAPGK